MKTTVFLAATAATVFAFSANAQLLEHRDLKFATAKIIAETAVETCKARGYPISVHVVDRYGASIVSMMVEGAGPHTYENARRKAYTAMTFKRPSNDFGDRLAKNETGAQLQLMLPSMSGQPGGVPIRYGEDVIAGVGVSGAGMGIDLVCAQAGIDRVAAQIR